MATNRLYFLDALRAFAILMMLQGHFISGLLEATPEIQASTLYYWWDYCRGFTAPVFFTITGWVFTFLLIKGESHPERNPRIRKGIKRSIELILWGYLLRLNIPMLLQGKINASFWQPDVLHIIGLGILFILLIYTLIPKNHQIRASIYLGLALLIFFTQPLYSGADLSFMPKGIAGYWVKGNGGVFYLFPWLGYVATGAFIAHIFKTTDKEQFGFWGLGFLGLGYLLVSFSSSWWMHLHAIFPGDLFKQVAYNNFLFIRLGNVLVLLALFIFIEPVFKNQLWQKIGSNTLSIYILHYFILYGSLTGIGLYKFYEKSLAPAEVIAGALGFMLVITVVVLTYRNFRAKLDVKGTIFSSR